MRTYFLCVTDTPAVTAAAPELIITSGMRTQPLHEYSWQHTIVEAPAFTSDVPSTLSGRDAAAGLRGPGGRRGGGGPHHEG